MFNDVLTLCILYASEYTHANVSNCNGNKISVATERYIYICVCVCVLQLFVRYVRLKNQTKRDILRNKKYCKKLFRLDRRFYV